MMHRACRGRRPLAGAALLLFALGTSASAGESGSVVLPRGAAVIRLGETIARLPLRVGERVRVEGAGRTYRVRVQRFVRERPAADADSESLIAELLVRPSGNGRAPAAFVRRLVLGRPDLTEDHLPGRGPVRVTFGRRLLDPALGVEVEGLAVEHRVLDDAFALRIRPSDERSLREAVEVPLPDLDSIPPERAAVRLAGADEPPRGVEVRIDGFRTRARLRFEVGPGGAELDPYLRFAIRRDSRSFPFELHAFDEDRFVTDLGLFEASFVWVPDTAALERQLEPPDPGLRVAIPDRSFETRVTLGEAEAGVDLGDTGYRVRLLSYRVGGVLREVGRRRVARIEALVVLGRPDGSEVRRVVLAPDPELSYDIAPGGGRSARPLAPEVTITIQDATVPGLRFLAGPGEVGLHARLVAPDGRAIHREVSVGEPLRFADEEFSTVVEEWIARPRRRIVAVSPEPGEDAGPALRVEMVRAGASGSAWVPRDDALPGFGPPPESTGIEVGDARYDVRFTRATRALPFRLTLLGLVDDPFVERAADPAERATPSPLPSGPPEVEVGVRLRIEDPGGARELEIPAGESVVHAGWRLGPAFTDNRDPLADRPGGTVVRVRTAPLEGSGAPE